MDILAKVAAQPPSSEKTSIHVLLLKLKVLEEANTKLEKENMEPREDHKKVVKMCTKLIEENAILKRYKYLIEDLKKQLNDIVQKKKDIKEELINALEEEQGKSSLLKQKLEETKGELAIPVHNRTDAKSSLETLQTSHYMLI